MLQALDHPDAVLALGAWAYLLLACAVFVDSVVPLVPSEVLCVAAGAFAATGRLNAWLVVPAVIIGGVLGDQATYHLGRAGSRRACRTMSATPRRRQFFDRLHGALSRRRTTTIVVARFLPGGRTGIGLLAGMTGQPRRGYAAASLLGVSLWAGYLVGAGYVAGRAADSMWVSIGIALALMSIVSVVAALRGRRRSGVVPGLRQDGETLGREDSRLLVSVGRPDGSPDGWNHSRLHGATTTASASTSTSTSPSTGHEPRSGPACGRCPVIGCAVARARCRGIALLLALMAVVGQTLSTYWADGSQGFEPDGAGAVRFGQYLSGLSWPLGLAALVLAAGFFLGAYAARLDLERALSDLD